MDHPMVRQIERTGYPYSHRREEYGNDALGNEVYQDDEILVFHGEFYLLQALSSDAVEILETHGASYQIAK